MICTIHRVNKILIVPLLKSLTVPVLSQGDLIISVSHVIEALTIVTDYTKKPEIIEIVDTGR